MKIYRILGVDRNSTEDEIKKAYHKMAIKLHPDRGGSQECFIELQTAWEDYKNNKNKVKKINRSFSKFGKSVFDFVRG